MRQMKEEQRQQAPALFSCDFSPSLTSSGSASSYRLTESIKNTSAICLGLSGENGKNKYVTELKNPHSRPLVAGWENEAPFLLRFGLTEVFHHPFGLIFRRQHFNCPPALTYSYLIFFRLFWLLSFSCNTFGVEAFPLTLALFIQAVCEKCWFSHTQMDHVTVLVSMDTPAYSF